MGTKYLKKDESLLYKQKIKSEGRVDEQALEPLYGQQANSRLFGLPIAHTVYAYQLGEYFYDSVKIDAKRAKIIEKFDKKIVKARSDSRKSKLNSRKIQKVEKKDKKLKEGNQLMRWGEELAVFDSTSMEASATNINNYLFSKGYFNSEVDAEVSFKNQKAKVTYRIYERIPYQIDSITYAIKDSSILTLFNQNLKKQQLKGEQYDQELLAAERDRVYELLNNNGYYDFKRQYVVFEVDSSSLENQSLLIREIIANPPGKNKHKSFRLDSITFTNQASGTINRKAKHHDNVSYSFVNDKYPERLLSWRIFLEKDSLYSKELTLETQRQLSYLDIFKFVNINYDTTGGQFVANIFTSPLKKFQTSTEVGMSVLDEAQGLPGPFFNFNAKSRNIFGGLEIIQFDASTSIQGIKSVSEDENNYSRFQYGGELSVTFPQFLFPLKDHMRATIGRYNPRTKIGVGVNFEDRKAEYTRTTFNGSMSYIWQAQDNSQFSLKPFDLSYIDSENANAFKETLRELDSAGNRSLVSAFQSSFVSFSAVNFRLNQNNYGIGRSNAGLLQGYLETGGNLQNVVAKPFGDSLEYYQYIKAGLDFRRNKRLSSKSQMAFRINVGASYAYGGNRALPYEKYFFAGGSNSIRAWQPRRLGPGAYAAYEIESDPTEVVVNNNREQPGDIILETSLEYRHDLIGFIDYALFVDAGNTWLWRSQTVQSNRDGFRDGSNDDGVFRLNAFYREIALGTGFGLRFDFSFLVLRVDLAYKIVDPAYPLGERFILTDYQIKDLWDFNYKAAINIGIGYPF